MAIKIKSIIFSLLAAIFYSINIPISKESKMLYNIYYERL